MKMRICDHGVCVIVTIINEMSPGAALDIPDVSLPGAAQRSAAPPLAIPHAQGCQLVSAHTLSPRFLLQLSYSPRTHSFAMPRIKKDPAEAPTPSTPPHPTAPAPYPPQAPRKAPASISRRRPIFGFTQVEPRAAAEVVSALAGSATPPTPQVPLVFRSTPTPTSVSAPSGDPFAYTRVRVVDPATRQSEVFYYRHHGSDATAEMFWTLARAMSGTVVHRFFFLAIACGVQVTTLFAKFVGLEVQQLAKVVGPKLGSPICAVQFVTPIELGTIRLRDDDNTIPTLTFRNKAPAPSE